MEIIQLPPQPIRAGLYASMEVEAGKGVGGLLASDQAPVSGSRNEANRDDACDAEQLPMPVQTLSCSAPGTSSAL